MVPKDQWQKELCRELSLCDEIRFVGKQQDMEEIFAIADLFFYLLSMKALGFLRWKPWAELLWWHNVGGLPEIVKPGENGYMGKVGDVDQMAGYAIEILKDETTLMKFRENAKKQAQSFDISRIVPQYEKLYEQLYKNYCKSVCNPA